jgi:hypothetical protein
MEESKNSKGVRSRGSPGTQFLLGPDPDSFDPPKFSGKINIVENYNEHLI